MVKLNKGSNNNNNQNNQEERRIEQRDNRLSLREAVSRLFDESFLEPWNFSGRGLMAPDFISRRLSYPRVDVNETDNDVKIVADVPGVSPDDIEVTVEEDRVILKGESKMEKEENEKNKNYYRYEREYGSFVREVPLPSRVKVDEAQATCKNGVVKITIPKAEPRRNKKIKIEEEK